MAKNFLLKSIIKSDALVGTSSVFLASIISTILNFLITTLLARSMDIEQFGLYRFILDTATIFFPLLLFGLQYTWTQSIAATDDIHAQSEQKSSVLLLLIICIVLVLVTSKVFSKVLFITEQIGKYNTILTYSLIIVVPLLQDTTDNILTAQGKILSSAFFIILIPVLKLVSILLLPTPLQISPVIFVTVLVTTLTTTIYFFSTGVSFNALKTTTYSMLRSNRTIGLPLYFAGSIALISRNILQILTGIQITSSEYASLSLSIIICSLLSYIPSSITKTKFRDFAKSKQIDKGLMKACISIMLIGSILLWFTGYIYVTTILDNEYKNLLIYMPLLLIAGIIRSQGEIINRFFYAKGDVIILSRISLIVGTISMTYGITSIYFFGIWGIITEKLVTAIIFSSLYNTAYMKFKKTSIL